MAITLLETESERKKTGTRLLLKSMGGVEVNGLELSGRVAFAGFWQKGSSEKIAVY